MVKVSKMQSQSFENVIIISQPQLLKFHSQSLPLTL